MVPKAAANHADGVDLRRGPLDFRKGLVSTARSTFRQRNLGTTRSDCRAYHANRRNSVTLGPQPTRMASVVLFLYQAVFLQLFIIVAKRILREWSPARHARVFPFRFGGESIPVPLRRDDPPVGAVRAVTGGSLVLFAEPVAEGAGVVPRDLRYGELITYVVSGLPASSTVSVCPASLFARSPFSLESPKPYFSASVWYLVASTN